jgi:hypothetical protein
MLTIVRITATAGMVVFFISGIAALLVEDVPQWLVLASMLVMTAGGLLAARMGAPAMTAYMPVRPNGSWWIAGCGDSPPEAFGAVSALEGCIPWEECEQLGWKIIAVKITAI